MPANIITLEVDGIQYTGFTGATVNTSVTSLCNTFSFTSVSDNVTALTNYPLQVGQTCKVKLNGESVINGFIEGISIDYNANTHNITVTGRDRTCDLIDSTLGANIDFNSGIKLEDVARKILKLLNMTDVSVINSVYNLDPFTQSEIVKSYVCQSAFDFLEQYAQKRAVLTNTDGNGDIVFLRAATIPIKTIITSSQSISSNTLVLNAKLAIDNTKRFSKYVLNCQFNPTVNNGDFNITPEQQTYIAATYVDPEIRTTRLYNFHTNTSFDTSLALERTKWEANIRKAKALTYTCTVQGFTAIDDEIIWRPNMLVTIVDDICDIDTLFIISEITYTQTLDGGTTTTLTMVDQNAFSLTVMDDQLFKKKRKTRKEANSYFI